MLVLSRAVEQRIVIGAGPDQIVIAITDIRRGKVRVGIDAPKHVLVHRQEVYESIQRREAAESEAQP